MQKSGFSKDIVEFLKILFEFKVKYLIVGGGALIYYGYARLTGDIDIFYGLKELIKNKRKMKRAKDKEDLKYLTKINNFKNEK